MGKHRLKRSLNTMKHIAVALITTFLTATAFAEPVDVYIFSGQSNMVGSATIGPLTDEQRKPLPHARYWNGTAFEVLTPGMTVTSRSVSHFGPELAFAQHYSRMASASQLYIIKYAAGGRGLHSGWNAGRWMGETPGPGRQTFYPGETPTDPNRGTLYTNLLKKVRPALAHLKAQGVDFRIQGVLWMQGEQDSKNALSAATYAKNLKHWHERLLADINAAPCPLVFGQVLPHTPAMDRFTHRVELRQSQANLDRDSGHGDAYPSARMVSTDGMELMKDTVHYSTAGQLVLGKAFAIAMEEMLTTRK
jgi:hypothetical protein